MKKILIVAAYIIACIVINTEAAFAQGQRGPRIIEENKLFFDGVFAPQEGYLRGPEKDVREEICLNGLWDFQPVAVPDSYVRNSGNAPVLHRPAADKWDAVKIRIPSPWNANSFARDQNIGPDHHDFPSYPRAWEEVQMAWMRKTVTVPESWGDKVVKLRFEAVAGFAEVYVNGKKVAENFDIFLPFEADITGEVTPGQTAEVLVGVRSYTLFDHREEGGVGRRVIPAGSMWGIHINGIWQDVFMAALPKVHIENVYVKPNVSRSELELDVRIRNNTSKTVAYTLAGDVREWKNKAGSTVLTAPLPVWELGGKALDINSTRVTLAPNSERIFTVTTSVQPGALEFWTPDYPNLYGLTLTLGDKKRTTDIKYERFGWREWTISGNKHLLNGEPIVLKGDSWHFMGIPQLTRRYAWAWFTMVKDANGNAVRPHAQIYPQFYLDVADEMGICILAETANWASDGGPKLDSEHFWEVSKDHLRRMVLRDRNHASVFGWSISNENKPVILNVFRRPDLMKYQEQAWNDWRDIAVSNDPTHPWISADGEDDGDGRLPVTLGHYGNENSMKHWASIGKPWGVGEHSMAYYGTPQQVSVYNGEDAYVSMEKRMEGIANESYNLISNQRKYGASYISVFNLAWYGLQPLAFGKRDITRPPTLQDGVYFTDFEEGRPGVQPERLGPYSSTLNPGYDPTLPLYIPWAMFDAIKAANSDGEQPAWSKWGDVEKTRNEPSGKMPEKRYTTVVFLGHNESSVKPVFEAQGVVFAEKATDAAAAIFIVDGAAILDAAQTKILKDGLAKGADMWLMNPVPKVEYFYNDILPAAISTRAISMSSFIPENISWTDGLQNSDFYFCEVQRDDAANFAIEGDFVKNGQILLTAAWVDWRRWNQRAEAVKTASVLRSERENNFEKVVFARCKSGNSTYYVSTLSNFANTDKGRGTLAKMLANAGIPRDNFAVASMEGMFNDRGNIMKVLRSRLYALAPDKGGFAHDYLGDESQMWNKPEVINEWTPVSANQRGVIDDQGMGVVYYSFWVLSPRDLTDLLIEPDMPKVTLSSKTEQEGTDVWLNGVKIGSTGALEGDTRVNELPMKQGWNHFLIKVPAGGGSGRLTITFSSENKPEFIRMLQASLANPDMR